jgi:UDP:flavonoid glycosyltransferase YjiC (YdhE family)
MRHGVPQALLPLHLEQYLVSRRARDAGVAKVLEPDAANVDGRAWLESAVADSSLAQAADPVARALAKRVPASAGARIARLLGS